MADDHCIGSISHLHHSEHFSLQTFTSDMSYISNIQQHHKKNSAKYVCLAISRRVTRILHWGGTTEATRVHFFLKKRWRPFFVALKMQWGPYIWIIGDPQNTTFLTSDRQNSVTLLNKAGHTSKQSQLFSLKKSTQSTTGGHGPLPPSLAIPLLYPVIDYMYK